MQVMQEVFETGAVQQGDDATGARLFVAAYRDSIEG
jgi:hypothetical protein